MTTSNMSLNEPSVGVATGPTWATETNANWELIDNHDHTSGKGVQLTPSSLNINADMEFNQNSATELKNAVLDNDIHGSASGDTNYSIYAYGANLYWRNGSGTAVQITNGASLNSTGGAITSPTTNSQVLFSSSGNSYAFKYDKTQTDGIAKMIHSDLQLFFYNSGSATTRSVYLKYLGSGTGANILTVPDETGTLLSTATSFAGAISIATSASNANISLNPNGTGAVLIGNGSASGKITTNSTQDLVLDTNSGTTSSSITITDGSNGNISLIPHGTGEIVVGSGSTSGNITSSGAHDLILSTNTGTNSGTISITDGANGAITLDTHGTGDINLTAGADINIPADIGLTFGDDGEKIEGDGTDLTIASSGEININSGTLDLSAQTVDVTLNAAVDALNIDDSTLSIDASNNRIGFGIAAPTKQVTVSASGTGDTTAPVIRMNSTATAVGASGVLGTLDWKSADAQRSGDPAASIVAFSPSADGSGTNLSFRVGSGSDAASECLRIVNDGDVFSTGWTARTWTGSGGSNWTSNYGAYLRIGYMCFITGYVEKDCDGNTFKVENLPYTSEDTSNNTQAISIGIAGDNGGVANVYGAIGPNTTILTFRRDSAASGWSTGGGGAYVIFSGWYRVNSI
jgi:hypothetical protein